MGCVPKSSTFSMVGPSVASGPPLRLLLPTVRSPTLCTSPSSSSVAQSRSPHVRPTTTTARLSGVRSRSGSTTTSVSKPGLPSFPTVWDNDQTDGERWFGRKCRFEIVVDRIELAGFQMYAVEKWIVERTRPVTVLIVYTGDPSHKIVTTALSPISTLTPAEADAEFRATVQHLRKQDGARPRETPQGTLMVTSLAHFRSDYTIIHIPDGDFLAVQDRLYSNINLLRMGCSGRSAVTLEEPSDATKDRFKSTYFLSDGPPPAGAFRSKSHSRAHTRTYSQPVTTLSPAVPEASALASLSSHPMNAVNIFHPNVPQTSAVSTPGPLRHPHFTTYVLELIKFIQAALAICGMFPLPPWNASTAAFDGLLCDVTIDGLRRWVAEIGEILVGLESTERIADPSVIAALLSFVLSTRNKLAACAPIVTKDPFLHPHEFLQALASWAQSQTVVSNGSTQTLPAFSTPTQFGNTNTLGSGHTSLSTSPAVPSQPFTPPIASPTINSPLMNSPLIHPAISSPASGDMPTPGTYLTVALQKSILFQHDAKIRHSDSRKVHRVVLSKLDLTSDSEATDDERKWIGGRVMGLVGRVGASGSEGGPASVGSPTTDLGMLVREVVSGRERERDRERERGRNADKERDKEKPGRDGESLKERTDGKERVGGSLKAFWSGKVELLAKMRERPGSKMWVYRGMEREREGNRTWEKEKDRLTSSDVDDLVTKNLGDDELAFGGAWSGKVQKRLEMWTGINRSKKSVDLSSPTKHGGRTTTVTIPLSTQSSSSGHVYPASELRGLGIPALVLSHDNGDEDELLSSGQVSPTSISRTRNVFAFGASPDVSSANLGTESEQRPADDSLGPRRYNYESGIGEKGKKISTWNEWERVVEGRGEAWWKAQVPKESITKERTAGLRRTRRHTFHDLPSIRNIPVLRTDWMRIDVELCGQILMMRRREAHLEGVVQCLEYLTTILGYASTALRNSHTVHRPIINALTSHHPISPVGTSGMSSTIAISPTLPPAFQAQTLLGLTPVAAALHALPVPPPVPALQYEAAQLRVDDMWASTREVRRKLWELRGIVFGGGHVLGVGGPGPGTEMGPRGRKGKVRRRWTSQWKLDGTERLVDALGRTESEAEEERAITADGERSEGEDEIESEQELGAEEKGVLGEGSDEGEREAMGPMWLLQVFMSWGARLGIIRREADVGWVSMPVTREPSPGDGHVGTGS